MIESAYNNIKVFDARTHKMTDAFRMLDECTKHHQTHLVFDLSEEANPMIVHPDLSHEFFTKELTRVRQHNSQKGNIVSIIVGAYSHRIVNYEPNDLVLRSNSGNEQLYPEFYFHLMQTMFFDNVYTWPSYFLTWGNSSQIVMTHAENQINQTANIDTLFCLKNGAAKPHRIFLLDLLAERNLLDNNIFTLLDRLNNYEKIREDVDAKYYTQGTKIYDNDEEYISQPPGYESVLMEIVAETHFDTHFFTEKTLQPLLLMKPFLIAGSQYINRDLEKFGFELYDEIFDYSFDAINSPRERYTALANEIERLSKSDTPLEVMYAKVEPKIKRNFGRLLDLLHHDEYMPDIIRSMSNRTDSQKWQRYIAHNSKNVVQVNKLMSNEYFKKLYDSYKNS